MLSMRSNARLGWSVAIIIVSAIYAVLVAKDPNTASALMLGYVAVLLTIFVINEVWKNNDR